MSKLIVNNIAGFELTNKDINDLRLLVETAGVLAEKQAVKLLEGRHKTSEQIEHILRYLKKNRLTHYDTDSKFFRSTHYTLTNDEDKEREILSYVWLLVYFGKDIDNYVFGDRYPSCFFFTTKKENESKLYDVYYCKQGDESILPSVLLRLAASSPVDNAFIIIENESQIAVMLETNIAESDDFGLKAFVKIDHDTGDITFYEVEREGGGV